MDKEHTLWVHKISIGQAPKISFGDQNHEGTKLLVVPLMVLGWGLVVHTIFLV